MTKILLVAALSIVFFFNPAYAEKGKVNINTASIEQLDTLKGVGPKKAKAIDDYRKGFMEHNPDSELVFETVEDFTQVPGIGPKTLAKNLDRIIVVEPVEESKPEKEGATSNPDKDDKQAK